MLIVGTGLTMADAVVSLHHNGHQGKITAISRRGIIPKALDPSEFDFDPSSGLIEENQSMILSSLDTWSNDEPPFCLGHMILNQYVYYHKRHVVRESIFRWHFVGKAFQFI